jgi:hypothetical protein
MFINKLVAMKAVGIRLDCYVLDMAASMAFQIFTQCSNRYALSSSFLLWHGVRTSMDSVITSNTAALLLEDLKRMDDTIMSQLDSTLNLETADIVHHFNHETLWTGRQLHKEDPEFLSIAAAFPEVIEVVYAPSTTRSAKFDNPFMNKDSTKPSRPEFWLMWDKYKYLIGQ